MMREAIGKLRLQGSKYIREGEREVVCFRDVWPIFHGRLFLYIRVHGLELERENVPVADWPVVILREEGGVAAFLRVNRDFWQYFRGEVTVINDQFTRAYSLGRIFEPLALVIDQEGATLASYLAASCLVMHSYGERLAEERAVLSAGVVSAADLGYSWGPSDADLAEWLFGIQAVGAVCYNGQPAGISRLQKWARIAICKEVPNICDRGRVLRNRKKERLSFTKKTAAALEKKWDQLDLKFD